MKRRGEMSFYPITIRPEDQIVFDVSETAPYPTLQAHLLKTYAGETMRYRDLLNEDYPAGHAWVVQHYTSALQAIEKGEPPSVEIERLEPLTPTGRQTKRIELGDAVSFSAAVPLS